MEKPVVSVVMSAYNTENTIRESVGSILGQTLENFELLIADDCSTDNTYKLLREMAARDDRIRLYRNQENRGQAYTRNMLFEKAQTNFIAIMDSDDLSEKERLRVQWDFMKANPRYGYTATWFRKMNDSGEISAVIGRKKGDIQKQDYLFGIPFVHPTVMFRLTALQAVDGYWVDPLTRFRGEDYDMLMRMCAQGIEGYLIPHSLFVYFEGKAAMKRRKLRYRFSEVRLRYRNFKRLGLFPRAIPYVLKPLIVGLIPQSALEVVRKRIIKKKNLAGPEQDTMHVKP